MKGNGTKTTALYCRLSQDDGNVGDSMSIQTQKAKGVMSSPPLCSESTPSLTAM